MSIPTLAEADNGYFYAHWTEGRRSKRKSMGTKDKTLATQRFAQWLLLGGQHPGAEVAYTIEDLWTVYYEKHVRPNVVGIATVDQSWANLKPHFAALTVPQIDQDAIDGYTAKRATGRIGKPSKPITVRRELLYLMAALNFCAKAPRRMFPKAMIEAVELPKAGDPRDRWLKMDEVQRLLDAARRMRRGDRLSRGERFLWIALETAARKQAILDLTWDRVDFDTGVIEFEVPGRRRTKKRRATVAISSSLRPVLERAYKERTGDLVMDSKAAVWSTIQHAAIKAGFSEQTVNRGEKPKGTGISPHVLRHTAATHMARRGVPLWKIANILGNTLAVVEKVYAKWQPDDPASTVDLISGGSLVPAE